MIQLKEIRLSESAPNIGVPVFANRRETSSFRVGVDGVTGIALDAGMVTVVAEDSMLGIPISACRWWKFAEREVFEAPKPKPPAPPRREKAKG